MNIALIAHDRKKELMVQFCMAYCGILAKHSLCATGTTGKLVAEATGLRIERYLPGMQGGEEQISARVSYNEIDLVPRPNVEQRVRAGRSCFGASVRYAQYPGCHQCGNCGNADSGSGSRRSGLEKYCKSKDSLITMYIKWRTRPLWREGCVFWYLCRVCGIFACFLRCVKGV